MLGAIGAGFIAVPIVGLAFNVPWDDIGALLASRVLIDALRLSLISSVAAAALSIVLGLPLAWLLARRSFPGKALTRGIVLLPLVLPPVVGGAALLFALGRTGIVGSVLESVGGVVLPFSMSGVVIANTFVAMPFLVITMEGAFRNLDHRFEGAAHSLGAGQWRVFTRVVLPMVRPSLTAGVLLAWARAFGEFGATLTFAGSLAGRTRTMPLAVFVALESDRDLAVALSLAMVVVALVVLMFLRNRWWGT